MLKLMGEAERCMAAAIDVSDGAMSSATLLERVQVSALVVQVPFRHRHLVRLVGDDHVQHITADIAAYLLGMR
jgi:thiamine monophosphate kinase